MSLLDRWKNWRATPVLMRRFLIEATLELVRARLLVAFRLKRVLPSLLHSASSGASVPPDSLQRDIRYILDIAVRTVPWKSLCLPNAIAAKRMLARRGFQSTLCLGVGHSSAGDPHAHAWLEAGGGFIVGEDGMANVKPFPQSTLWANRR